VCRLVAWTIVVDCYPTAVSPDSLLPSYGQLSRPLAPAGQGGFLLPVRRDRLHPAAVALLWRCHVSMQPSRPRTSQGRLFFNDGAKSAQIGALAFTAIGVFHAGRETCGGFVKTWQ
jgi:hypothetical protein